MRTIKKDGFTVRVLDKPEEAREFVRKLKEGKNGKIRGFDFETTALRPDEGPEAQVRLSSICKNPKVAYIIDHFKCGSFASFCTDLLDAGPYYVFNANFEGRWFEWECDDVTDLSRKLFDVAHMRRSVLGGGPLALKDMTKRDLKIELDKDLQNSDWSNPKLTADQYFYAGLDAIWTRDLAVYWSDEMDDGHWNGFHMINDAWRAVNECEDTGLLIDVVYHRRLIKMWGQRRDAAEYAFRKYIPEEHLANIRSKKQFSDFLKTILDDEAIEDWPKTEKTAQLQTSRNILRTMSFSAPYPLSRALAAYMVYTRADKYLSTYGETLLTKQELSLDGRVHGRLNMAAAITGRFSSSNPNQQNFPRSPAFRYSFIADEGMNLILADYSGVEIRVLAELSGDKILLHDCIYDDVHARSAIAIYQQKEEEYLALLKKKDARAKEMRSKAKGFTFQLLYGAGAAALALVLRCSVDEAQDAINKWAARYKKAYEYRLFMFEKMNHKGFLPCKSGRTIYVRKPDRSMPVAANYPIQGTAADVMYRAMFRVQELLDKAEISSRIMASVHDELLLLSEEECAEDAKQILRDGMIAGWLDVFPDSNVDNLVDAVIGDRWSDKE